MKHPANDPKFRPNALIVTERDIPSPIFVAAFLGVDKILRLDLDETESPSSYVDRAMDGLQKRLEKFFDEAGQAATELPAFGIPTGIVINYAPDCAVRFDLEGHVVEMLRRAVEIGEASVEFGKFEEAEQSTSEI